MCESLRFGLSRCTAITAFALAVLTSVGCGARRDEAGEPVQPGVQQESATPTAAATVGEATSGAEAPAGSIHVRLVNYSIEMPDSLPSGATTFHVVNNGTHEHNFEVEGQGNEWELERNLQPGESGTLEVELQPGTYTVYCPVGKHRERGMVVTLTVIAPAP